jgi:hypothetical protein
MYSGEPTGVAFPAGMGKNRPAYLPGLDSAPPGIEDAGLREKDVCNGRQEQKG